MSYTPLHLSYLEMLPLCRVDILGIDRAGSCRLACVLCFAQHLWNMCGRSLLSVAWQAAQITEWKIPALSHTAAAALRFVKRMESVLAIRYQKWEWRLPGISASNHQDRVWLHYSLFLWVNTGMTVRLTLGDFVCLRVVVSESWCLPNVWPLDTFSFYILRLNIRIWLSPHDCLHQRFHQRRVSMHAALIQKNFLWNDRISVNSHLLGGG